MTRKELEAHIFEVYSTEADHPWMSHPEYAVFRHGSNHKWFAVTMCIPKVRLGLNDDGMIDIINIKCDPLLISSLLGESGFFPAYHMSKTNWISIALDGSADEEKIKWLLDMSYDLTAPKIKKKKV